MYMSFESGESILRTTQSLKKNYSFRFVYNRGKSIANKFLVLYVLKNGLPYNRLGISVSKKVGNSVVRSRVTRLIRESFRLNEENFKSGFDIVFIARASMNGALHTDVTKSLLHLMKKHDLLQNVEPPFLKK